MFGFDGETFAMCAVLQKNAFSKPSTNC